MLLREIAHSRAGDKGNRSTISVIAYDLKDFPAIEKSITAERVRAHYVGIALGRVERFVLPQLGALNFVLHDALGGGVTRSLALDAHGKCLSSAILTLSIDEFDQPFF
ncbi:MAG: hypothetical protein D4R79_19500 [Comamonadaceae bacterium]|nr:MAG: hypothetical protein D4R79_19500 [Comamonadaceae bacterium]